MAMLPESAASSQEAGISGHDSTVVLTAWVPCFDVGLRPFSKPIDSPTASVSS